MSPEAPGNLVALDIATDGSGFVCSVERYDPTVSSGQFMHVSWNAITRPSGYEPVAGGAAYVDAPPGFEHRTYEARLDVVGPRVGWQDKAHGDGLMLIALLPYGYVLPGIQDADPPPVATKLHDGRMAVYWLLAERTRATWRLERADAGRISTLCSALNEAAARQSRRSPVLPVVLVNHAAVRQYPRGLHPDEALAGFHDLCAWIGEHGGDEAQISFTGMLLTFLVAGDPVSRWFQSYVGGRTIALADMLGSKGFASQEALGALAARYTQSDTMMVKPAWTPSAREVLSASEALAQRVGGEGCAIGIRHVMGAYCLFHYPNHAAQLRNWGFDLQDWVAEYRVQLRTFELAPAERAGWHVLLKEMGIADRAAGGALRSSDPAAAATPGGWDIFIAHGSADKARAEQLYERLMQDGHRVFFDARSLRPGDFWALEIPRALATSRVIVILITSDHQSAHYLQAEIADAIQRARQIGSPRVVPVYLDGPLPDGVAPPYGLGVVQAIDAHAVGGLGGVAEQIARVLN